MAIFKMVLITPALLNQSKPAIINATRKNNDF